MISSKYNRAHCWILLKLCSTSVSLTSVLYRWVNILSDVHFICADWTLLKDNAYFHKILLIAKHDTTTRVVMLTLTSFYYKKYLSDESVEKEWMKKLKIKAIKQLIIALKENATKGHDCSEDAVKMLLIHHAILNQNVHFTHWIKYLY